MMLVMWVGGAFWGFSIGWAWQAEGWFRKR